jgi:hypothetical protein
VEHRILGIASLSIRRFVTAPHDKWHGAMCMSYCCMRCLTAAQSRRRHTRRDTTTRSLRGTACADYQLPGNNTL